MKKVIWMFSLLLIVTFCLITFEPSAYSGEATLIDKMTAQIAILKKEQAELEAWLEKLSKYFVNNPQMLLEIGKFRSSYVESKAATVDTIDKLVKEGKESLR